MNEKRRKGMIIRESMSAKGKKRKGMSVRSYETVETAIPVFWISNYFFLLSQSISESKKNDLLIFFLSKQSILGGSDSQKEASGNDDRGDRTGEQSIAERTDELEQHSWKQITGEKVSPPEKGTNYPE